MAHLRVKSKKVKLSCFVNKIQIIEILHHRTFNAYNPLPRFSFSDLRLNKYRGP